MYIPSNVQVSTAITGTLSLNKVVKLIVEQAVELLEHSACALLVLDEMGEGFRLETSVGLSDELLEPALQARMARVAVERKKATALYLEKDPEALEFEGVLNSDRLHPSLKGYQIWADALKPIFTELLGPPAAVDLAPPPTGDPSAAARGNAAPPVRP